MVEINLKEINRKRLKEGKPKILSVVAYAPDGFKFFVKFHTSED